MHFDLSDDQRDLRDGIRSLLDGAFPIARVREGFDRSMWDELVEAGVFGLRADGFTWADAAVVFEELGRAVVPGPLVWGLLAHDPTRPARIVGGLERPASGTPAMVEHLAVVDSLVVLDADGVSEVDPAAVDRRRDRLAARSAHPGHPGRASCRPASASRGPPSPRSGARRAPCSPPRTRSAWPTACTRPVGRLRQGARAVRPADRFVPGREAPLRRHGGAGRGRPRRDARGRRCTSTIPGSAARNGR